MEQLYPGYRPDLEPECIYDHLELPGRFHDRPYVALNMVSSIDGKITLNQNHQDQKLGSSLDRELMLRIRAHFDGVLRGAETVRANPSVSKLPPTVAKTRLEQGKRAQPLSIVASRGLDLPVSGEYFRQDHRVIVLTTDASDAQKRDEIRRYAEVEVVGEDSLDVHLALLRLRERYEIEHLLLEGGARLNYAFIQAGVVDSVFWTLAPKVSGLAKDLTMVEGPELLRPIPTFTLQTLFHHENELFFHWSASR